MPTFFIIRLMDNEFISQPAKDKIAKKRIILYKSAFSISEKEKMLLQLMKIKRKAHK